MDILVTSLNSENVAPNNNHSNLLRNSEEFASLLKDIQLKRQIQGYNRRGFITQEPNMKQGKNDSPPVENKQVSQIKDQSYFMAMVEQTLRDNMLGIDREKIEALEKEIEAVKNDPRLSANEKADKLKALQNEKDSIIKAAVERMKERLAEESRIA